MYLEWFGKVPIYHDHIGDEKVRNRLKNATSKRSDLMIICVTYVNWKYFSKKYAARHSDCNL